MQLPSLQPSQQTHSSPQQQVAFATSAGQAATFLDLLAFTFEQQPLVADLPVLPLMAKAAVSERSAITAIPSMIWFFVIMNSFR